jgi:ATP-dependent exoDNAse (exonuclease V) beta subunit
LLVDEFQDTSPDQVELLRRLTADWQPDGGRSLFLVGDPMQSIYRFRKADVGLFLAATRAGIGGVPLERLRLFRNNRACAPLVEWVNASFRGAFPRQDDAAAGAVAYRKFAATRSDLPSAGVVAHGLVASEGEDEAALEAERLLAIIDAERAGGHAKQIAVLVRARAHLDALVARIRRQRPDLRFAAVEIETLAARQPVQDLLALTRALHHRADRVNWLAILRAPWCGLTLADLHALAGADFDATIWSLVNDAEQVARLSADGQVRLLRTRAVIAAALIQQGRQPPSRWLMGAWLALGGPACLANATELADCEAFFALVDKLDAAGRFTPDELDAEMARLFGTPDALADGSLQFMTLHKSKGLEFDTVILPALHRPPRGDDSPLMRWEEVALDGSAEHLIAAPLKKRSQRNEMTPYDYLGALEKARAANEAARLLYVGATRAIRRLHLVGVVKNRKDELAAPANTFLSLLWPVLADQFTAAAPAPAAEPATPFVAKLLRVAAPVALNLPTPVSGASASEAAETGTDNSGQSLDALAGILTHLYLQIIANEGIAAWPATRVTGLRGAMELWLTRQGCVGHDAATGAARVAALLETTLASETGRWLLGKHEDAAAELALQKAGGDGTRMNIVDRTFIENGTRWIIDYKTTRPETNPAEHAKTYHPQLARYADLFSDQGLPIRCAIYYAALGEMVEV